MVSNYQLAVGSEAKILDPLLFFNWLTHKLQRAVFTGILLWTEIKEHAFYLFSFSENKAFLFFCH